jgi:uncharacterized protein YuzB (UPF0349 family)
MVKVCKFTNCFNELTSALDDAGIDYSTEECLGRCDLCHSTAFVQKDDEFISDDKIDILINKIK